MVREGEEDVQLRCSNPRCPAKLANRLKHFVSRRAFDIESLGEKLLEQLVESGRVVRSADLFTLEQPELAELPRLGEKSAANIITALEGSKSVALDRFIYALGIRHVGEATARSLAEWAGTLAVFLESDEQSLQQITDVGPRVAGAISAFLQNDEERENIELLLARGVNVGELPRVAGGAFAGERVVITGSLQTMDRAAAQAAVREAGGEVSESVGKQTTLLVAGENAGSKLEKAARLGVAVINEREFLSRLGQSVAHLDAGRSSE